MNIKKNLICFLIYFMIGMCSLLYSQAAGDSTTDPIIGTMRLVPATGLTGTLQGSPEAEPGHSHNEDQFTHILTRNLWVMETEVTQQMWSDLIEVQPTLPAVVFGFPGSSSPVENISWYHAVLFANLLSQGKDLTRCYYADAAFTVPIDAVNYTDGEVFCDFDANGYRLPTEGEWEYFTRAGTSDPFSILETEYNSGTSVSCDTGVLPSLETAAWFCANSGNTTHPAGTKIANSRNLKDVHGNVSEWCWDWWDAYPVGTQTDYQGPSSGGSRVIRGGSWDDIPSALRSASRSSFSPDLGDDTIGFRLVRNIVISVTSPVGGEYWEQGTNHSITWTAGDLTGDVSIELYKGGVIDPTHPTIGSSVPVTDGTFSWDVPVDQATGSDYRIRISQGDIQVFSANFTIYDSTKYLVSFLAGTGGTITGDKNQVVDPSGNCTEVTAVPDPGYHFKEWTGTGGFISTRNPLTVTYIKSDMEITAIFSNTYTVTFEAGPGGSLTGPTTQVIEEGEDCAAVTAVPNTGYNFINWTESEGKIYSTNPSLTITNVTSNMTILANFTDAYTVTFKTDSTDSSSGRPGGYLTGSLIQVINYDGSCTPVTATAQNNYRFKNWTGTGGFETTTQNPLTVKNVKSNMTVTAHFEINSYEVTFQAGPNGDVEGVLSQTIPYGGSCNPVTAAPHTSYRFINWTLENGTIISQNTSLTVKNVISTMTIKANFAPDQYHVYFVAGTGGSISGILNQTVDYDGTCGTVEAKPDVGYKFVNWTGPEGFTPTDTNPLTLEHVKSDKRITANFEKKTYTVTFLATTGGSVSGSATQTVTHGNNCTPVQALPNPGYRFVDWTGTGGFTFPTTLLTVTDVKSDMTITANFEKMNCKVIFKAEVNGTLNGGSVQIQQIIPYGESCDPVEATPNPGYRFVNWSGDGGFFSTVNPIVITNVTKDMTITANFSNTYTVTFQADIGGTLIGTLYQTIIAGGDCTAVTAVPNTGYTFTNWTGTNGFVTKADNPLIVTNVTDNMTITANFTINTYTVTFTAGAGGTLSYNLQNNLQEVVQVVPHGSNCNPVTAVPATGKKFVNWTGTDFITNYSNPLTVTNVTSNMSIKANFATSTYKVIFQVQDQSGGRAGGTLNGLTTQVITHGGNCSQVTAVPGSKYNFVKWTDTGGFVSTANPLTVTNVTSDMVITANFTLKKCTLTFLAGTGGTLNGLTSQEVDYDGTGLPVTAVPNTGYLFVNWTGTGGFTSVDNPLTVKNVTINMTITANFKVGTPKPEKQ